MKSIIKNLIVLVFVAVAITTSTANTYPTIHLSENKTLVVNLNDWTNSDVTVTIRDAYGAEIYRDEVSKGSSLGKRYNLSNIATGEYELIIDGQLKKAIQKIEVMNNSLVVQSPDSEIIFKSIVEIKNDFIDLNQLALGRNIKLMISDKNGVFFSKQYDGETTINKRFDIKGLPQGEYTIIISGANQYDAYAFTK